MRAFPPEQVDQLVRDGWWSGQVWQDHLDRHASGSPDKAALVDPPNKADHTGTEPRRLTWAEVATEVERLASALHAAGVRPDDVVGVQLPNCVELPIALLAVGRVGAIVSPFPIQYRRHELTRMGRRADLVALVTYAARVGEAEALKADLPTLHTVLDVADLPAADPAPAHRGEANDVITLAWTSGTEGEPKGVPRAYGDWEVVGHATIAEPRGCTSDDVLLNLFPMVNAGGLGGMFMPWLLLGARWSSTTRSPSTSSWARSRDERVTYTCAPPLVLDTIVGDHGRSSAGATCRTLRAVGSGSAPLVGWMIEAWERDHGVEVLNLFGSNEGGILFADPDTVPDPYERGRLFPRYGDPDMPFRHAVGARDAGPPGRPRRRQRDHRARSARRAAAQGPDDLRRLLGRRPRRVRRPTAGSAPATSSRSPPTAPTYLVHVDRAKDLIVRGGYKISAAELESLVSADPAVAEVAAVAMPDARLGERVCVFVVAAPGHEAPSLEDVVARLRAQDVATFKLP